MIVIRGEALRNPMWELRGGERKFTGGTCFYFFCALKMYKTADRQRPNLSSRDRLQTLRRQKPELSSTERTGSARFTPEGG